jgi:Fic family protein
MREISIVPETGILTAASYFLLKFESIHPFADGNGRTGRTLMNYYLMINGLPPTILYEEDKKMAPQKVDTTMAFW